jgi:hypothetical protein
MEIFSVKEDTVLLLYHADEGAADVGQQFVIHELPDRQEGLVVQVLSNGAPDYPGLQQELIQRILEQRIAPSERENPVSREQGMEEIKRMKIAICKIRKRVKGKEWRTWDGWIPTRNVSISPISASDLLEHILPTPSVPLRSFATFNERPVAFDGPRLRMVNAITGVKGSGKSHLAKHLVLGISQRQIPVIIFDINGEYIGLPNAQVLRFGEDITLHLAEVGWDPLIELVRGIHPLKEGSPSEALFENQLPMLFEKRREHARKSKIPFTLDIQNLKDEFSGMTIQAYVKTAIQDRLDTIDRTHLFWRHLRPNEEETFFRSKGPPSFQKIYDDACLGRSIVFDLRRTNTIFKEAVVKSMIKYLERICEDESEGQCRYPFVFFEESHFYMDPEDAVNLITRGRHIGIASVFVTNTPQRLPEAVFRQLDNLFLLPLTHQDDIRNVSKNSFTDEETIQSFATRMPLHHALMIGDISERYPLMVRIDPLPAALGPTGETRSTWARFLIPRNHSTSESFEQK